MRRVALGIMTAAVFLGCGGSKTQSLKDFSDTPEFVLNPPKQAGALFGTGISKQKHPEVAKEIADLRAKKEITSLLSQMVSNMMKDYLGQAGIGSKAEIAELAESVTQMITEVELVDATIEKREYVNEKMYSLVKYQLDDSMKKLAMDAVRKWFSSNEALLSEFSARRGYEGLDKEFEKMKFAGK